jgi:NADPH:quinone reductase-like Zn-dependent oxidoreductase
MDLGQRHGIYPVPAKGGKILGVEVSGVIKNINSGEELEETEGFKTGDEVLGLAYGGTEEP